MKTMNIKKLLAIVACVSIYFQCKGEQVLFNEDWSSGTLDISKWRVDSVPFESATSLLNLNVSNGILTFSGTIANGYWGGSAVATIQKFTATPETNLVLTVNRASLSGSGTAYCTGIWLTDETRSKYIFIRENVGEGNWQYNQKIGAANDKPNGTGVLISSFNQPQFTDHGSHTLKAILNGSTVRVYLDGVFGAEIPFPFTSNIVFEFGAYARAPGDVVNNSYGNIQITAEPTVIFCDANGNMQSYAQMLSGSTATNIFIKIPPEKNATEPFSVTLSISDTNVILPTGNISSTLTVNFPAGGSNIQPVPITAVGNGGVTLTIQDAGGVLVGNSLRILVPYSRASVLLEEDFSGDSVDNQKWQINNRGFESGSGNMSMTISNGQLVVEGRLSAQYWGGVSLKTVQSFIATKELNLVFELDLVAFSRTGTAGRRGVYITTADRSTYLYIGQNWGETGWAINSTIAGNPTGGGSSISAFSGMNDGGSHKLKLIADGSVVKYYLDGVYGGETSFPVSSGIYFEIGTYARALGDTVRAVYDNPKIYTIYSPMYFSPSVAVMALNDNPQPVSVVISPAMVYTNSATVTIISSDPSVAIPEGANEGVLTINFSPGGNNVGSFNIIPVGVGTATFIITNSYGVEVANNLSVTVTESLYTLMTDDFSGNNINPTKWFVETTPFEANGYPTNDSYIRVTNNMLEIYAVSGYLNIWWAGYSIGTKDWFYAKQTAPVSFEIDRVAHIGTGAARRTGVLIADSTRRNWIFFADDDLTGGWGYATSSGGIRNHYTISAFAELQYKDGGNHRIKVIANGATVKLYLDGVFGVELPFPYSQGIIFEVGAYARSLSDSILGKFDNAIVRGPIPPIGLVTTNVVLIESEQGTSDVTIKVPYSLRQGQPARITVRSDNPSVAIPAGSINGETVITVEPDAAAEQTFTIQRIGKGIATFTIQDEGNLTPQITLMVVCPNATPSVLFSDSFGGDQLSSRWAVNQSFRVEPDWASSANNTMSIFSGQLEISCTAVNNYWPGVLVALTNIYDATPTDPVIFEIDRVSQSFNAGASGTRSGVYIYDETGTYFVLFANNSEISAWSYNRKIGQPDDNPTNVGITMNSLSTSELLDYGVHRLRVVANGQTVRFYVDDILGAEIPFPFSRVRFAVMAASRANPDSVVVDFANAQVLGTIPPPPVISISKENGNIVIKWDSGILQEANMVTGPWNTLYNVQSPLIIPLQESSSMKFYRAIKSQ